MANAAFYIFLRMNRGKLIKGFRDWLGKNSLDELKVMIKKGELPEIQPEWVITASEHKEGIRDVSFKMWFEFIAEANPALADYINSLGYDGGAYIGKLRAHFLDLCDHPEKMQLMATAGPVVVTLHCDKCDWRWPIAEDRVTTVEKCPHCGARVKD